MGEDVALEFAADVEAAVASVRELAAAAQELAAAAKEAQGSVAGITAPAAEAGTAVKEVAESSAAAGGALTAAADEAKSAAGAYGELASAATGAADAEGKAATAAAAAGTATEGAAAKSGAAAESGLGKYKMALVGIGVGAAVAVDAAGKFQDSTTHLVTDAGESAKNLAMVQQGILSVSAATGTSANDITNAMYHIESSGFHAASGLAILKTTAEGAKVGGADLDTTSKALVGTLTAYYGTSLTAGQATKDSTALMNELITTVASGDMRMQDLASSLSNVTPVAAAAHISFAQVGGALATMTAQGMSARQASQNLAHAIRSLASPTNVQAVEMKAMGLSANDVARNLGKTGLAGTFQELSDAVLASTKGGSVMLDMMRGMSPEAKGLADQILAGSISTHDLTSAMKELNPQQYALVSHFKATAVSVTGMQQTYTSAMSKMLGGATGLNVGLMLTGTHMKDLTTATKNIAAEGAKASSTVDNWSTIQGTFKFKLDQAKASLEDTGIALGSALLPAVTAVLGPIAHFLALIASNKAASIALAVVVGGILAGAIGLKLAGALKDASEGIKAAGEGVEWLIGKFTGVKGAADAAAAGIEEAAAAQEAAGEDAWKSSGDLAAKSAAAQEAAAEGSAASWEASAAQQEAAWTAAGAEAETEAATVATANEEAAAESSTSWIVSAARQVAAGAVWVAQSVAKVAVVVASNVAGAASTLASWVAAGAGMLAQGVMWVAGTIAKVAVVVGANIAGAVATAAAWVVANAVMLLGIGLVVAAVALAVYEIVTHWSTIVHGVEEAWNAVYSFVSKIVTEVVDFVKSHWMLLVGILLGPIALVVALLATYWGSIQHGAEVAVNAVISFFTSLPGKILAQLATLPGSLLNLGTNMIVGLYNGIVGEFNAVIGSITNLGSTISHAFSSVLGIFSPSRVFFEHGRNTMLGYIDGVRSQAGAVASVMAGAGGQIASAGVAGAVAPASGGSTSVHVSVPVTAQGMTPDYSDPRFSQYMQGAVQDAVLRYAELNPSNGLTPAWGH